MYIKKVQIKNFRSIISESFQPTNLNVLVGNNDIGKSNFLKALNLFFNNQTDLGHPFDFKSDFCEFAPVIAHKAPEISIEITFSPPKSFKENRDIIWEKKWRRDGQSPFSNEKKYSDKSLLEGRKKVGYWLDHINYWYVPAVKSQNYFSKLLSDLHNVLAETIEAELKSAASGFIEKIRDHTLNISDELLSKLGFKSNLQIPNDLSSLFEILDFQTEKSKINISLKFRGDGIKTRYIPIILNFIAQQGNINKDRGAIKSNTIWGYEEPENNLELTKAFEHAQDFVGYSKKIQIFLTSHSPAFYSLQQNDSTDTRVFLIKASQNSNQGSSISPFNANDIITLDREMGLLPYITPHIKKIIDEKNELLKSLKEKENAIIRMDKKTLFVEGQSDKLIISKAFELFYPEKLNEINIEHGGGVNWVADMLAAWHFGNKSQQAIGLFDKDPAATAAKEKLHSLVKQPRNFKTIDIIKPSHLININKKGIKLYYAIEELFSVQLLSYAKSKNWLEFKNDLLTLNDFNAINISFKEYYQSKGITAEEELYFHKIKTIYKADFTKYLLKMSEDRLRVELKVIKDLIDEILLFS